MFYALKIFKVYHIFFAKSININKKRPLAIACARVSQAVEFSD